ncbi:hypothetical protein Sango_0715100 [Sesamum angolense]|uniref:Uncharacterized protein n=1 Tax=Sesamum angolense TaxID=2727404 RepID=A0AAE1X1B3_9LAMI|nr:hypothetical protein Sango_0715100 [Sesamum angolense]
MINHITNIKRYQPPNPSIYLLRSRALTHTAVCDSFAPDENGTSLHAKRKRVIVELVKGKEIATRLQTLLRIPGQDHGSSSVSPGDLAFQILRSFNETLSVLSSSCAATSPQIAGVDCGGSACSGESKQKPGVKSRRGCYKRRSE